MFVQFDDNTFERDASPWTTQSCTRLSPTQRENQSIYWTNVHGMKKYYIAAQITLRSLRCVPLCSTSPNPDVCQSCFSLSTPHLLLRCTWADPVKEEPP